MKHKSPTKKRGIATLVALVTLAVVGTAITLFMQTIVLERRQDAEAIRNLQADYLARDVMTISEMKKRNAELTVPKSALEGVAELRLESNCEEIDGLPAVTVKAVYLDEDRTPGTRPTFLRQNQHAKRSHDKKQP